MPPLTDEKQGFSEVKEFALGPTTSQRETLRIRVSLLKIILL